MTELKPVAVIRVENRNDKREVCFLTRHYKESQKLPAGEMLYAIPEGYHIVAIDPTQQIHDNLDRHNEKLRELTDDERAAAGM